MNDLFALLAIAILVPALSNWRLAVLLTLMVGFGQDLLRKLTPGEPVYMVLLFAPVFAIAALGLMLRGGKLTLGPMFDLHPTLRAPVLVFLWVVALQILLTISNTGSVMLAGLGAMVYILPLFALVVAMYIAGSLDAIVGIFTVYIVLSLLFSLGVYLNVLGYQDGILDSVGEGLFVYPKEGGVLKLPSGFFRTPETAAWHSATAVVLASLLVMLKKFPGGSWMGVLVITILVGAVVLTGRRKMVVELFLFVALFAALLSYYGEHGTRLIALSGGLCAAIYLGQLFFVQEQTGLDVRAYVSRYDTVAQEATGRFQTTVLDSWQWVIARNGWFGAGAGTSTQGSAQFGGGNALVGASAEGGVGKLLAELGVHGVLACIWMLFAFVRACHESIIELRARKQRHWLLLAAGLAAFLLSNGLVFATAAQVFGDPFVLLILGLALGFVLRARSHGEQAAVHEEALRGSDDRILSTNGQPLTRHVVSPWDSLPPTRRDD